MWGIVSLDIVRFKKFIRSDISALVQEQYHAGLLMEAVESEMVDF